MRLPAETLRLLASQGKITLPPKPSKYKAKRVETDEGTFDSQAEHRRWCALKLLERAGVISGLERQVPFPFEIDGATVFKWVADAVYTEGGVRVVEDVKGMKTPVYRLKKKLIEAQYRLNIIEVR